MKDDPTIANIDFPMDGMTVTVIDPWFVNAYGRSFMGSTPDEVRRAAAIYGELHDLPPEAPFAFQIKEPAHA